MKILGETNCFNNKSKTPPDCYCQSGKNKEEEEEFSDLHTQSNKRSRIEWAGQSFKN